MVLFAFCPAAGVRRGGRAPDQGRAAAPARAPLAHGRRPHCARRGGCFAARIRVDGFAGGGRGGAVCVGMVSEGLTLAGPLSSPSVQPSHPACVLRTWHAHCQALPRLAALVAVRAVAVACCQPAAVLQGAARLQQQVMEQRLAVTGGRSCILPA